MVIARRIGLALAIVAGAALLTAFLLAPARADALPGDHQVAIGRAFGL